MNLTLQSRGVLAWRLADKIDNSISVAVLEEAFKNSKPIQPIVKIENGEEEQAVLKYMTDGGSENKKIDSKVDFAVNHLVAWKNIRSSNSMIERVFHTMKNEYKYILFAADFEELNALLAQTINAYMDRPHSQASSSNLTGSQVGSYVRPQNENTNFLFISSNCGLSTRILAIER